MAEQMTLEQARDIIERSAKKLCDCGACKESKLRKEVYDVLNSSHLNAAKGEVDFDTTYHGVMIRKMTEMLSNNEWADLFTGDDAIAALQEQISRLVANTSAAKGEVVAWRYRFYGSQGWVYATAGEELVCGLPLIYSQPLYNHPAEKFEAAPYTYAYRYPDGIRTGTGGREINGCKPTEVIPLYAHAASPDVVRDAERYRWLEKRAIKESVWVNGIRGAGWYIGPLSDDGRLTLVEAIDAAIAAREGGE